MTAAGGMLMAERGARVSTAMVEAVEPGLAKPAVEAARLEATETARTFYRTYRVRGWRGGPGGAGNVLARRLAT